jgi:hypothetical protein
MAVKGRRFGQKYPQGSKFEGFDESAFFGELVSNERTQRERDLCDSASRSFGAGLPTFRAFRHRGCDGRAAQGLDGWKGSNSW